MNSIDNLAALLSRGWKWTVRVAWIALFASSAIFLLEAIHLHQLLAGIHPWLAWSVSGALALCLLGALGWFSVRWWCVPRALYPPELPPTEEGWTARQRQAYLRFARRYLERQQRNPALDTDSAEKIPALLDEIARIDPALSEPELVRLVEDRLDGVLEILDRRARQEVWQAATQVAALTAVNPSALLDVLITLVRNLDLMARLATLYGGRPGVLASIRITRDVLATAITAGILDRIAEGASSVAAEMVGSWTTRLAGPVGQGIVNGLVTVRLGDAAVARCRSLRSRRVGIKPWSSATWREMARRLSSAVSRKLAPEVADAFKRAGRRATAGSGSLVRKAFSWLRRRPDEEPPPVQPAD